MQIGIIGAGNMGSAIAKALIENKVVNKKELIVSDTDENKLKNMDCKTTLNNKKLIEEAEIIILAIKPQSFEIAGNELKGNLSGKLIISIMAGISLKKLEKTLKTPHIIRSMPNTPALVSKGMTVFFASPSVTEHQKVLAKEIFRAFGKELEVMSEDLIDAATAISGSGPAYVFYLAENIEAGALNLGFSETEAKLLTAQTLLGASSLLVKTGEEAGTLRKKVTSPGGTTEAAMKMFKKGKLDKWIRKAIESTYNKAKELGK